MPKTTKIAATALALTVANGAWARNLDPTSDADNYADAWVMLEADRVAGQTSIGTTTPIGHLNLASNLVVTQAYPGVEDPMLGAKWAAKIGDDYRAPALRLDVGPALSSGGFFFLPKIGIGYDFARKRVGPLSPQLMTIIQGGPVYFESWMQLFLYDLLDDGAQDSFYTRDLLLVALSSHFAIGPQIEAILATQNSPGGVCRSLPVGLRTNFGVSESVTLGLFVGYEFQGAARNSSSDFLAGRVTATVLF